MRCFSCIRCKKISRPVRYIRLHQRAVKRRRRRLQQWMLQATRTYAFTNNARTAAVSAALLPYRSHLGCSRRKAGKSGEKPFSKQRKMSVPLVFTQAGRMLHIAANPELNNLTPADPRNPGSNRYFQDVHDQTSTAETGAPIGNNIEDAPHPPSRARAHIAQRVLSQNIAQKYSLHILIYVRCI
jgi:hypothetical protein